MRMQWRSYQFWGEVVLSIGLAIGSAFLATISPFDHLGGISLALILGMLIKAFFLKRNSESGGLGFSAKTLLRVGIVLLGTRLDFAVLAEAGLQVLLFDLFMVVLGVLLISTVLKWAGFEPILATLAAVGSSICGASAIAAAAPAIRANKETSALAIVACTLIGTIATFLVIPLQSVLCLAPNKYGILAGATLHEVAQVAAALAPVSGAFQTGMATKLLRVVFLVPVVALLPRILPHSHRVRAEAEDRSQARPQVVPWYVAGFLGTGVLVTLAGYLPSFLHNAVNMATAQLVQPTNVLIGASMAAIGLQVDFAVLKKQGAKLILTAGLAWLALFTIVLTLCWLW
ncbi:MAG: putative sulfate exporter family transporter [Verrucomicrobia bacterium]|nr:putative sulfate exporter family transporter [Verrucomicrobiota bacterium]MBV8484873.1 putative sulfate exporter family transporter [Verrucomicrobiota bacterium]